MTRPRLLPLLLLLLAACGAPPKQEAKQAPPNGTPQTEPAAAEAEERAEGLAAAEQRLQAQREYEEVMYTRHLTLARRFRDRGELDSALTEADSALRLKPSSEEAIRARAEILVMLGRREGEVETLIRDTHLEMEARQQQRVVEVRRNLDEAKKLLAAGNREEAKRHYEIAIFIVDSARRQPAYVADMDALRKLAQDALDRLRTAE